ncbi:MAG TPA: hypothetical protein VJG66_00875 [Patescibacteria group bacterium]|nr:hypothetical protein [Patescibacteria group bacterium]
MGLASAEIVTIEERQEVVDAFNQFYDEEHAKELAREERYKGGFRVLEAGVRLATGQDVIDPARAIPPTYDGDGSFETRFEGMKGNR